LFFTVVMGNESGSGMMPQFGLPETRARKANWFTGTVVTLKENNAVCCAPDR
jgi:hypothetical protein